MNTDSQQKNEPDFPAWKLETLAKFAQDAWLKMREQEAEIEQLRQDLKMALNAYRELLKK